MSDKLFDRAKSVPLTELIEDGRKVENAGAGKLRVNPCPLCDHKDCFTIFTGDNSFFCYSCNKGGTAVDFVMHRDGITPKEAAEKLTGDRPNLEPYIPPLPTPDEKAPGLLSERAFAVREFAAQHYFNSLMCDAEKLKYQTEIRKHPQHLLTEYRVGVSHGDLMWSAKKAGFTPEELEAVGLARRNKNNRWEDYIWKNHFVYPHTKKNRVIWFTVKDPSKRHGGQMKKMYKPDEWICYGQNELENSRLFICEGENDLLSLQRAVNGGVVAINATASNKTLIPWLKENGEGKTVYLCFDGDEAGRKYAENFGKAALKGGAKVYRLEFPDGTDPDDFIRGAADPKAAMGGMIEQAVEILPAHEGGNGNGKGKTEILEEGFFDTFKIPGLMPVGVSPDDDLWLYDEQDEILFTENVNSFRFNNLLKVLGNRIHDYVARSVQEAGSDNGKKRVSFDAASKAIIGQARKNILYNPRYIGQGIHKLESGDLLIINGSKAFFFDGGKIKKHHGPVIRGENLLVKGTPDKRWICMEKVVTHFTKMTPEIGAGIVKELEDHISQWRFASTIDVRLLTGFFLAQIVQSAWRWRPHLWVTGQSNSGKSTLYGHIRDILGKLCLDCEATRLTEPGLRHGLGDDTTIPFIDEFESDTDRDNIIKLLRSAGRGGKVRIGGMGGKGVTFKIQHMAFVASVAIGIERAAEKSRFLVVNTIRDTNCRPKMLNTQQADELRHKMVAYALWAVHKSIGLIDSVSKELDRNREAAAVPLSMFAVTQPGDREKILLDLVNKYEQEFKRINGEGIDEDEDSMMGMIMSCTMRISYRMHSVVHQKQDYGGEENPEFPDMIRETEISISEILFNDHFRKINQPDWGPKEYATGVLRIKNVDYDGVFFASKAIKKHLLRNTRWENEFEQMFSRIPGCNKKYRPMMGASRPRGFFIPIDYFMDKGFYTGQEMGDSGTNTCIPQSDEFSNYMY